jgi:CRP/FNR family transcriptional regulator
MGSPTNSNALADHFPTLVQDSSLHGALRKQTQAVNLAPSEFICMEGTTCAHLALVLDGTARVYKSGAGGREITLYRVNPGESCILTTSCILSNRPFPAFAVAETAVEARVVPSGTVQQWMDVHPAWQRYVFDLFASRLDTVIATLEEVAFHQLDARLAGLLIEAHARADGDTIRATHEQIASDLGSAREVVSRLLKDFEHDGLVELGRGRVTVTNRTALQRIAGNG